jgi:hypothetical protein
MNFQALISYLILATAVGYSIVALFKVIFPARKAGSDSSCVGQCGGCDAVKFRDELKGMRNTGNIN